MFRLKRLPRSGHWEVDLVPAPGLLVKDVELLGLLLVADRDEGTLRQALPVRPSDDLVSRILQAASKPAPTLTPSRPRTIRCRPAL